MNFKVNIFVDLQKKILRKNITNVQQVIDICDQFRIEKHKKECFHRYLRLQMSQNSLKENS